MNVTKKDGSTQEFDKNKICESCKKAGASEDVANKVADAVASRVEDGMSTRRIGEMVVEELKKLDENAGRSFEEYFRSH